jgi:phospholipase/carboxylesterase
MTGWRPALAARRELPVFIAHGERDAVIDVRYGREADQVLRQGGLPVEYHEFAGGHEIAPALIAPARAWLDARLPARAS